MARKRKVKGNSSKTEDSVIVIPEDEEPILSSKKQKISSTVSKSTKKAESPSDVIPSSSDLIILNENDPSIDIGKGQSIPSKLSFISSNSKNVHDKSSLNRYDEEDVIALLSESDDDNGNDKYNGEKEILDEEHEKTLEEDVLRIINGNDSEYDEDAEDADINNNEEEEGHIPDSPKNSRKRGRYDEDQSQQNIKSADLLMSLPIPPWVDRRRRYSKDLSKMLEEEIDDYVKYLQPTPAEHAMRQLTVERIARLVTSIWPTAKTHVFGSFETKLYLPSSDIDIVVMDRSLKAPKCLYMLSQQLRQMDMVSKMEVIAKARVPIIKLIDSLTGFAVDISFNIDSGLESIDIVKQFLSDPTIGDGLLPLMLIMKQFLLQRNLNEVYSGGMGSYALVTILAAFLKMHPKLQTGQIKASQNIGVLLMEFLELYGYHFNYEEIGLTVQPHKGAWYFRKNKIRLSRPSNPNGLCILDPQDPTNDVGGGTKAWPAIRHEFMKTHRLLNAIIGAAYERPGSTSRVTTLLGSILTVRKEVIEFRENVRDRMTDIAACLENGWKMEDIYVGSLGTTAISASSDFKKI